MDITVSFDNEGKIRVLDEEKFDKATKLQNECNEFANSKLPTGPFFPPLSLHRVDLGSPLSPGPALFSPLRHISH